MKHLLMPIIVAATACAPSGPAPRRTVELVRSHYTIPAGTEFYQCEAVTVTEDLYVKRLTPIGPLGVHHTMLGFGAAGNPDGQTLCGPFVGHPVFASGVNSAGVEFPDPAVVKISAGQQIVFNLHLFNATQNELRGDAGIDAEVAAQPQNYETAGITLVGPYGFVIDSSRTVDYSYTAFHDATWFAVFPHMHQTGQHMKVSKVGTGGEVVVSDSDFQFDQQTIINHAPVAVVKGDQIRATCTYDSDGIGKQFGDSSTSEMCFAITFAYPSLSEAGL